ncbi:MAG: hypothetical protein AAFQ41_01085 [Cyanobacteria bacterium J06623_7]
MGKNFIWQQNSSEPNNSDNLAAIASWWSELAGQEVVWQQRLVSAKGEVDELDWQPQKFDEQLSLEAPEVKGITLYWRNKGIDERNITPRKLQLNTAQQNLYIWPQSQSQVVIKVSLPVTTYQKFDLSEPQIAATIKNKRGIILLRDETEKLEIKVTLSPEQITQLLDKLKIADNQ